MLGKRCEHHEEFDLTISAHTILLYPDWQWAVVCSLVYEYTIYICMYSYNTYIHMYKWQMFSSFGRRHLLSAPNPLFSTYISFKNVMAELIFTIYTNLQETKCIHMYDCKALQVSLSRAVMSRFVFASYPLDDIPSGNCHAVLRHACCVCVHRQLFVNLFFARKSQNITGRKWENTLPSSATVSMFRSFVFQAWFPSQPRAYSLIHLLTGLATNPLRVDGRIRFNIKSTPLLSKKCLVRWV